LLAGSWGVSLSGEFTLETVARGLSDLESRRQIGKAVVKIIEG
jgi:hypothetical protein